PKCAPGLERFDTGFTGTDANGLFEIQDENLAVANAARLGGVLNGGGNCVDLGGVHSDLNLEFGQEVNGVFGSAINLGVAFLAPISLDFGDGHAVHVERVQRLANLLKP